jgi:hypothetical protein
MPAVVGNGIQGIAGNKEGEFGLRLSFLANYIHFLKLLLKGTKSSLNSLTLRFLIARDPPCSSCIELMPAVVGDGI